MRKEDRVLGPVSYTHLMLPEVQPIANELISVVQPEQSDATELLIKLHDIVADETDETDETDGNSSITDEPIWMDYCSVIYANSNYRLAFPGWPNSVDLRLYLKAIYSGVDSIKQGTNPIAITEHFDAWTGLCLSLIHI